MIMLTTTKLDTSLFHYNVTPIKSIYIFISFTDAYGVVKSQKYIYKNLSEEVSFGISFICHRK